MKTYGINNEVDYLNYFDASIKNGVSNFAFKGENGTMKMYKDIVKAVQVKRVTKRSAGICNKGDILLFDKCNISYPLSIKMDGVKTAWESADYSLRHVLHNFIDCYGRIELPSMVKVKIDNHAEDLEKYVFGDDIIPNDGTILIQTFNKMTPYQYNSTTAILNCHRVYNKYDEITDDTRYAPVISVRKDPLRNKSDERIKGYRVEVIPSHSAVNMLDIIDLI